MDDIKQPEEGGSLNEEKKPEGANTESTDSGSRLAPVNEQTPPTPPKREDDEEKVTISKGELRGLLSEVEQKVEGKFEEKLKGVTEELGILREASDEKRLFNVERAKKGPIQHVLGLFVYEDRVVVGWRITKDEVYKNPTNGVWTERQGVEIILEADADGNEKKVEFENYLRFDEIKRASLKEVKILGKENLEDGSGMIVYRVEHPIKKGEDIRISAPFVN